MNKTFIAVFCDYYQDNYIINVFLFLLSTFFLFFYLFVKFLQSLLKEENEKTSLLINFLLHKNILIKPQPQRIIY